MKRYRMILAAAFVVAALAFPAFAFSAVQAPEPAPVAEAQAVQDDCSGVDRIYLFENGGSDNSDGDDELHLCGHDYSDLNVWPHEPPGNCAKGIAPSSTTWNDCVSSVRAINLATGQKVCFYRSTLGTPNNDLLLMVTSANDNITHTFSGPANDALSGIDWRQPGTANCPDPAP